MLTFVVLVIVLGVGLYLVDTLLPMAPPFKVVLRVAIVLILLFALWRALAPFSPAWLR